MNELNVTFEQFSKLRDLELKCGAFIPFDEFTWCYGVAEIFNIDVWELIRLSPMKIKVIYE